MTPADMQNQLFDKITSALTLGVIPDFQTAVTAALVCFMAYVVVDIVYGNVIRQWWDDQGEKEEYEKYKKRRERSEKFKNTYEAQHGFTAPPELGSRKQSNHLGL